MNNKVIVITRGAQWIGRKIETLFLINKWILAIWAICSRAGDELTRDLNHPDFLNVECNVAIEVEVKAAFRLILERFGRIDVLVNNAAITLINHSPLFHCWIGKK